MANRIIIDFDNTMGIRGCDIDDGLALLYLIGCPEVEIAGICTTFGNNRLDVVHENTLRLVREWGLNVPVLKGRGSADRDASSPSDEVNEAAAFIANAVSEAPGQIGIVATGSMTNIGEACEIDGRALEGARGIFLMGGITESLVINGRIMDELNLSCNADAAMAALSASCPVHVATAHNCLPASFGKDDIIEAFGDDSWMMRSCRYWFEDMDDAYDWDGWVCWDVVAAAYAVHPELFEDRPIDITLNRAFFGVGLLEQARGEAPATRVNAPVIKDGAAFRSHVIETWSAAIEKLGL